MTRDHSLNAVNRLLHDQMHELTGFLYATAAIHLAADLHIAGTTLTRRIFNLFFVTNDPTRHYFEQ